jgi:hypothetical protein
MAMNGAYFNGLDQSGGMQTALANIPGSVTTDYILFSLNVAGVNAAGQPSADINFGWNLPLVLASNGQVTSETAKLLIPIVRAGVDRGKCQRVWLTVGAAVDPKRPKETSTFANIQTFLGGPLKSTLLANFGALAKAVGSITGVQSVGFDMDYEEGVDQLASRVANITVALYNAFKCPVTFCPFQLYNQSNWIAALQQVYSALKTQPVVGYNLQTYSGGSSNNPADWANTIAKAPNTGVAAPAAFVWPIVSCSPDAQPVSSPSQVAQQLKNWVYNGQPTGFHSKGASLWATQPLSNPPPSLTDYSKAIAQGIA